jgi:hypothetical protein
LAEQNNSLIFKTLIEKEKKMIAIPWYFGDVFMVLTMSCLIIGFFVLALQYEDFDIKTCLVVALVFVMIILETGFKVNSDTTNDKIGKPLEFSELKNDHQLKFDAYSHDLGVGFVSDQEKKNDKDRRLVKNIMPALKPGDVFVISKGQVFIYKANPAAPAKPPEKM